MVALEGLPEIPPSSRCRSMFNKLSSQCRDCLRGLQNREASSSLVTAHLQSLSQSSREIMQVIKLRRSRAPLLRVNSCKNTKNPSSQALKLPKPRLQPFLLKKQSRKWIKLPRILIRCTDQRLSGRESPVKVRNNQNSSLLQKS